MSELVVSAALPSTGSIERRPTLGVARMMVVRALRLSLRNVDGLITALALPVLLMLMFVYLFGGAIDTGMNYVNYVVPGVVLVCIGFGAATTAVSVASDLTGDIIDRFRSMDVRGESLINGHVVASVARNLLSTALVFTVAFAIGFRSHASVLQWIGALGILTLFVLAFSWLAAAIGILARSAESANGMTFLVSFLPYPSSAFTPIKSMPSWLQGIARNQPVTPVIDSVRGLLLEGHAGASVGPAIGWSLAVLAGAVVLTGVAFRVRTR